MKTFIGLSLAVMVITSLLAQTAPVAPPKIAAPAAHSRTVIHSPRPMIINPNDPNQAASGGMAPRLDPNQPPPPLTRRQPYSINGMIEVVRDAQGNITAMRIHTLTATFNIAPINEEAKALAKDFEGKRVQVFGNPSIEITNFRQQVVPARPSVNIIRPRTGGGPAPVPVIPAPGMIPEQPMPAPELAPMAPPPQDMPPAPAPIPAAPVPQ